MHIFIKISNILLIITLLLFCSYCLYSDSNHTGIPVRQAGYILLAMSFIMLALFILIKKFRKLQFLLLSSLIIGWAVALLIFNYLQLMMNYEDWIKAGMPVKPI